MHCSFCICTVKLPVAATVMECMLVGTYHWMELETWQEQYTSREWIGVIVSTVS